MKHPVLTRVFAMALAILCLISLLSGIDGVGKARSERLENDAALAKLMERIENFERLEAELEAAEMSAEELEKLVEQERQRHEEAASEHVQELATYTATKGALQMGAEQMQQADAALMQAIEQYNSGLAAYQQGVQDFEAMKQAVQALSPIKTQAEAVASECGVKAGEISQLIAQLSADPTAEIPGLDAIISAYAMALSGYTRLAAGIMQGLSSVLPGGAGGSAGVFDPSSITGLSQEQQLAALQAGFGSTATGLGQAVGMIGQMEAVIPSTEKTLAETGAALDQAYEAITAAIIQLEQGQQSLAQEQGKLSDTQAQLEGEKGAIESSASELQQLEARLEAQRELENKHSSARILLNSYAGIRERAEAGLALNAAARAEHAQLSADYAHRERQLVIINALLACGAAFGIVALLGAFELLRLRKAVRALTLICLLLTAAAYSLNLRLGEGQYYVALFTGVFAFIQLFIAGEAKKKVIVE